MIAAPHELAASSELEVPADCVMLAHGGGGESTSRLIAEHLLPQLDNALLSPLTDAAVVPWDGSRLAFTTDSYVVTPLEFPGGDIGRLAVCGTVNDLAVMGAIPVALSLGLILEEGLPFATLDRIVASIRDACAEAGARVVTGDTKVIERRSGGGLMINTAGVGRLPGEIRLGVERVQPGDAILISGTLADHGLTIMAARAGLEFESTLRSDAAPLLAMIQQVLMCGGDIKFLRDPTRGGLAGVLADISERREVSIDISESRLPISPTARHAAELLGLDPLTVANEGKLVCICAAADAPAVLRAMKADPHGRDAAMIGHVTDAQPPLVELATRAGGRRVVQRPYGEELPRIC